MNKIEKNYPFEFVSKLSKKESSSRKPIYSVHKWFSRKPDALIRSVLLEIFDKKGKTEESFYENNENLLKNKIVLDPFLGGGTTAVNVLKTGGKFIGVDINPMSLYINHAQLINFEQKEIESAYEKLCQNTDIRIKNLYKTNVYGQECEIIYVHWAKETECNECGKKIMLFPTATLTNIKTKNFQNISVCPKCYEINSIKEEIINCSCGNIYRYDTKIIERRKIKCPHCGNIQKTDKKPENFKIFAIQYYNPETNERGYKKADIYDIKKFEEAEKLYSELNTQIYVPDEDIPYGDETERLIKNGYKKWKDMFNKRQLLSIISLKNAIEKIENKDMRNLFFILLSNLINSNNRFCIFQTSYNKSEPLFGDHHFAPVNSYTENNIFGQNYGAGTLKGYYENLLEAKKYNLNTYERKYENKKSLKIFTGKEKIISDFAENFKELGKEKNILLKTGNSGNLGFIPEKSVDLVLTDPPYYSSINYSELTEFFYVWIKKFINQKETMKNVKQNEIGKNRNLEKDSNTYEKNITKVFREIKRVLKDDSYFVFTYNNSYTEGWEIIINSIIKSGFSVKKTWPVDIEKNSGLIDKNRSKMNLNLLIICKKNYSPERKTKNISEIENKIKKIYSEKKTEYFDKNVKIAGIIFEYISENNIENEGKILTVKEILEKFLIKID